MGEPRGHVLITGSSTGIGRACAIHLAELGFQILAGVRAEADGKSLEADGGANVKPVIIDVTDSASIARAAALAREICGDSGLLGLVNNAGISVYGPVEHVPLSEWRRQ